MNWLGELQKQGLLAGTQVNEQEGMIMAVLLEAPPQPLTQGAKQMPRIAAMSLMVGNVVRLWHVNEESCALRRRPKSKIGVALAGGTLCGAVRPSSRRSSTKPFRWPGATRRRTSAAPSPRSISPSSSKSNGSIGL